MTGQTGVWGAPVRGALAAVEACYAAAITVRNRRYDRTGPQVTLPVPVLSVGNITVGGTGKTPLVIELVQRLERLGRTPAVVSRGYRAPTGQPNDEELVIRAHCPTVVCLADADRAAAALRAHERFGADVIVLDDGFQHRRLARCLDLVVVDATCPFGYGRLLPRGLLREPASSLRRAHLLIVSRCDQRSRTALEGVVGQLRRIVGDTPIVQCNHRVSCIERLDGSPISGSVEGKRAVLFAGIGHPQAFETTARSQGLDVVGVRWWPDHHHYRLRDVEALLRAGAFPAHDFLLTTEKDAIKVAMLDGVDRRAIAVLKIAIDFSGDGGTILQQVLKDSVDAG